MGRTWTVAVVTAILYLLLGRVDDGLTGLTRTIKANTTAHEVIDDAHVSAIDLEGVPPISARPEGVTVIWRGVWEVGEGAHDLRLDSHGPSSWSIDDTVAIENAPGTADAVARTVWLPKGFHTLEVRYRIDSDSPRLSIATAPLGRPPVDLSRARLKPRLPRHPWLRAIAGGLGTVLGWLSILTTIWAVRSTIGHLQAKNIMPCEGSVRRVPWLGRGLAWTTLTVILVHGALLRIDAITGRFGVVSSPSWMAAVQMRAFAAPTAIRPSSFLWEREPYFPHRDGPDTHYRSDPYTYLDSGRRMTQFYMAQFREPVFPFATMLSLRVFDNQDVAVSFASTAFSVLAIWLTYVLGAAVWSRPAGLLAALGLSLDVDVVSLASLGWRDDAYMATFTLCTYLMWRWWRVSTPTSPIYRVARRQVPAVYVEAAFVGIGAGFAILTRFVAIPVFVAGVAWIVIAHTTQWRRQLPAAAIAAALAVITAGPYFVNCWRVFGDPLHTFNAHGNIYSAAEGQAGWKGSTVSYVREKIARRPVEVIDTMAQGVTSYPFMNKWHGLERWAWGIGDWALRAGLAGLVILASGGAGRLLIVITLASLLPFSLTWTIDPDFRFTVYMYPVLLVSASIAGVGVVRVAARMLVPRHEPIVPWPVEWRAWGATMAMGLALLWFVDRWSPLLAFAESLHAGNDVNVSTGVRDSAFFGRGWSEPIGGGNVRSRVAIDTGELFIRLPQVADYPVTIRMDPFPRPLADTATHLPTVEILLNGTTIGTVPLRWTAARVGSYDVVLPRAIVKAGSNRVALRVVRRAAGGAALRRPGLADGEALSLWYLRAHPAAR